MDPLLQKFDSMIVWKSVGSKRIPEPVRGLDGLFDDANENVTACHKAVKEYEQHVRKQLDIHPKDADACNMVASSSRLRYELEFKDSEIIRKLDQGEYSTQFDFYLTGKKGRTCRY